MNAMSPELRAWLDTWTLANWREYCRRAKANAEGIYKRPLTADESKRLRRAIFDKFRKGEPSSAGVAGLMFTFWEKHKGEFDALSEL